MRRRLPLITIPDRRRDRAAVAPACHDPLQRGGQGLPAALGPAVTADP